MLQTTLIVLGVLLVLILLVLVVFRIGMRRKTPWVLDAVRRFARGVGNPFQMRKAGKPGAMASVIEHRGRTSGKAYRTPIEAVPTADGFLIATVYGDRTDWLKNVLANGSAVIVYEGQSFPLDRPELIPVASVKDAFPDKHIRALRRYRVTECLRLRRTEPIEDRAQVFSASETS